jgi:hypothetical protein
MAKKCTYSQNDKKMIWAIAGTVLLLIAAEKTNQAMLQWYDRGLETLALISTVTG